MTNLQQVCQLWADIKDFEGLYQVSLTMDIRSLPKIRRIRGFAVIYPIKILKKYISKNGYLNVTLWKDGVKKTMGIHRIIAETFIENPFNLKQVNHINGIKTDNRIENLEWISQSENILHALSMGLIPKTRKRKNHPIK